ncbi:MAG: hypothetical protein IJ041_08995 [Clostridia bacterium]|nr:hypothetical protein [Clostridia bacterium]
MEHKHIQTRRPVTPLQWISWGLMVASPFLLMGLLCLFTGRNVWNSWPVWSNELDCYRVLQNFGVAASGYNGMYEVIPPVGNQSVLGIAPLFFYGAFVRLFGLSRITIMLCNCLWLSTGALVFCAIRRPKASSALFFTLLTVCYVPLALYLSTSMPEAANYGLLMLYATFLLHYDETHSLWSLLLSLIFGLLACLYRIQYVLLFLPLAWHFGGRRFGLKTWLALLVTVILAFICAVVAIFYTAPTIQSFHYHLLHADSLETAIQLLLSHTKANVIDYFSLGKTDAVQAGFRLVYLASILVCLFGAFVHTEKEPGSRLRLRFGLNTPFLVVSVWLLGSLCIIILLYETADWWDFRMLAPVLWLTALCLFMTGRRIAPLAMLGGCLLLTAVLALPSPIGCFADPYRYTEPPRSEALTQAMEVITFEDGDPAAGFDPFDNTVRTDLSDCWQLTELQPGLGLETGWFIDGSTGRSRWLLTDMLKAPLEGYKPVFKTDGMSVYRRIED